jgi:hypothetical protein
VHFSGAAFLRGSVLLWMRSFRWIEIAISDERRKSILSKSEPAFRNLSPLLARTEDDGTFKFSTH